MGVSVEGEPSGKVPQYTKHSLDVHSVLQGQCCEGVAEEVMEADLEQACPPQHSVEHIQHAIRTDGAAIR